MASIHGRRGGPLRYLMDTNDRVRYRLRRIGHGHGKGRPRSLTCVRLQALGGGLMRKLVVRTAQWLLENPLEQPGWVVEDLVPCGLTLIAGDPKIGKSWFGLDPALCVATGEPLWGFATAKGIVSPLPLP